jgi:2-methylisocitrate lyase-like PEP mutase family enzyme
MSTTQADKARLFIRLHQASQPLVMPNPWDIGTARILTALGFEALATTSAGMAFAMGRRDGAVSREQAIAHVRSIVDATHLPVSADLENGFGDAPEFVADTIRMAAAAGLAGGSIEDSTGDAARPIYDKSLAVERIVAAVAAARSLPCPFVLTARAENFLHGRADLDDTIARLQAYEAAGADVLYAPGLRDLDQIRRVCQAVSKPVNVLAGLPGSALSVADLGGAGVRRISVGALLTRVALGAFLKAAKEIKEHGTFTFTDAAASMKELSPFFLGRESASK